MRNFFASAMVITMALCFCIGAIVFGSVAIDTAVPMYALGVLLSLIWAARLLISKEASFRWTPLHVPVIAFFLYALARYFSAPVEYYARLELFQVALFTLCYFVAACNLNRSRDRNIFLTFLMVLAIGESAYGIWQFTTKSTFVFHEAKPANYGHRASGTFICPNHLAGLLEMAVGLFMARVVIEQAHAGSAERKMLRKVFMAYAALMSIAAIVLTTSRAGWVSTSLALGVFLLWGDWRTRAMWPRLGLGAVALIFGIVLASKVDFVRDYVGQTLSGPVTNAPVALTDPSIGGRTHMWRASVQIIQEAPLLGTGPASWRWFHQKYRHPSLQTQTTYAHNDILNLISDYGIIGGIIVLAALVCFGWRIAHIYRHGTSSEQKSFAVGAAIASIAILFHSWFDFNLHIPSNALLFVIIMALTVAIDTEKERRVPLRWLPRIGISVVLLAFATAAVILVPRAVLGFYYYAEGNEYKQWMNRDESLQFYEKATAWDPKFPLPHARIGDVYAHRGQFYKLRKGDRKEREAFYTKAIDAYQTSLRLNPYDATVMLRLAKAYSELERNDEALLTYQRALTVDPYNAHNYMQLGFFYRKLGEDKNAADAFEAAQTLNHWSDDISQLNLIDLHRY